MSELKHESDALEYSLAMVLADIRIKTGVGDEPMLFELADILAAKINGANHKPIFPVEDILDSRLLKQIDAKNARIAELEAALRGWQKVPEGHVVVPAEPTLEMQDRGADEGEENARWDESVYVDEDRGACLSSVGAGHIYRAMIAAKE